MTKLLGERKVSTPSSTGEENHAGRLDPQSTGQNGDLSTTKV